MTVIHNLPDAKPNERAILIVYYGLKIKSPHDIASLLSRDISFIYKTLKKFRGPYSVAQTPQFHGKGYSVVGQ